MIIAFRYTALSPSLDDRLVMGAANLAAVPSTDSIDACTVALSVSMPF
jgi:hypothetical protein